MATALRTKRSARSAAAPAWHIFRVDAADQFDRLDASWHGLQAADGCPASQFGWLRAYLTAFAEDATPHFMALVQVERPLAAAPLVCQRVQGIRRLLLAGTGKLRVPGDFAWHDERHLSRLASAVIRDRTPLWFERIRADSPTVRELRRAARGRAIAIARPQSPYSFISLGESWFEPERNLDRLRRERLRVARRAAEGMGPLTTEIHTPGLHELPSLLDRACEIESRRAALDAPAALAAGPDAAVFYRQYAAAACVEGALRVSFLRIGEAVVAVQLAIESNGAFWLLNAASDRRFATCLPDQLLLSETIRYAAESNLETFEFWGGSDAWTPHWSTARRECVSLRVYPLGARGLAALAADAASSIVPRAAHAMARLSRSARPGVRPRREA